MERLKTLIKELKEAHECQSIQIKKLEEALDIVDNKLTEMAQATDAIRYDHEQMGTLIKKMEEI